MQTLFCQRWRERRASYRPAGEIINPANLDVAPIDYHTAKQFVTTHHYSKSYPACRYRFGLFSHALSNSHWRSQGLQPELVGVAVFSVPQHPAVLTNVFPGDPNDSTELGRFVLLNETAANAETFFLARCFQELQRIGLRGVVAFADDVARPSPHGILFPGHLGIIYQSLSWAGKHATFGGRGARKTIHLFADGTTLERRTISKIRNREQGFSYACHKLINHGATTPGRDSKAWLDYWLPKLTTRINHPGCLRFSWSLDRHLVPVGPSLPYPKRFASAAAMDASRKTTPGS